jgi:hypothetical protein
MFAPILPIHINSNHTNRMSLLRCVFFDFHHFHFMASQACLVPSQAPLIPVSYVSPWYKIRRALQITHSRILTPLPVRCAAVTEKLETVS